MRLKTRLKTRLNTFSHHLPLAVQPLHHYLSPSSVPRVPYKPASPELAATSRPFLLAPQSLQSTAFRAYLSFLKALFRQTACGLHHTYYHIRANCCRLPSHNGRVRSRDQKIVEMSRNFNQRLKLSNWPDS